MTAEVAVMNSMGVALAADSAVTIGQNATKIYTSAEKLFQLSNLAPVGIMIYGNASFTGIPWETTIKAYRKHLGSRVFPKLDDYAKDLLTFISRNRQLFPTKRQDLEVRSLIIRTFLTLRQIFADEINTKAEEQDGLERDDIKKILANVVAESLAEVKSAPFLPKFARRDLSIIRKRYTRVIGQLKKEIFGELPFNPSTNRHLNSLVVEVLARDKLGPTKSGVVISGFGETEYLPSVIHLEFEDMALNRPRYKDRTGKILQSEHDAAVMAFAQQDMVYSFMQGITSELLEFMRMSTLELFVGAMTLIIGEVKNTDAKLGKKLSKVMKQAFPEHIGELFEAWDKRQKRYWEPVVQIVSTLPKDELAAMAENLVNLTKFRRRVTTVHETVGGPIDVAIITKGDGFVWYKRKLYFDPKYNPRVMARLERG